MSKLFNLFFQKDKIAFVFFILFACVLGACLRLEQWFDFFNYHYYNVWAFFNNRWEIDVVPSFANSFFSPLADMPAYFLINALNNHPVLFSAIISVPFGINLFVLYKLAALFFPADTTDGRLKIGMTLLLSVCSTNILGQVSSTSNDSPLTVFVLIATYLLLKDIFVDRRFAKKTYLISGFLFGAATALKLTFAPYAVAAGLTVTFFYKKLENPLKIISIFGTAMFAGFLVCYGYWGWILWQKYENPVFPFFNSVFHSPYWWGADYKDSIFFACSKLSVLLYPFCLMLSSHMRSYDPNFFVEVFTNGFSRIRLPLAYIAFILVSLKALILWYVPLSKKTFLAVFLFIGYLVWLFFFRVERYLFPLEFMLSLSLIAFFFQNTRISLKSIKVLLFLAFIIAMPSYTSLSIWPLYPRNDTVLPTTLTLPEDSLLVFNSVPSGIYIPSVGADKTMPAVIHPHFRAPVNGSDFFARGIFDERRNEILTSWLDHPEKDIYIVTFNPAGSKEIKYTKTYDEHYIFHDGTDLPCRDFYNVKGRYRFYICRQSLKNLDPDDDFSDPKRTLFH